MADAVRREKLELVLAARAAKVAPKPDDAGAAESKEPPAHELLSGSSLVALEKEHIAKVMAKRNKKESFEQNQAEFFAARHRETVETAQRKHDSAEAFRKKLAEEQAAKFAAKGEAFARKQQNARDGFRRWEEGKEEQRRQMYERDAAVAARSMQFEEERDMDLFNRSMDFAAKVEMCGERSQVRPCPLALALVLPAHEPDPKRCLVVCKQALLDSRVSSLMDAHASFEKRAMNRARTCDSETSSLRTTSTSARAVVLLLANDDLPRCRFLQDLDPGPFH